MKCWVLDIFPNSPESCRFHSARVEVTVVGTLELLNGGLAAVMECLKAFFRDLMETSSRKVTLRQWDENKCRIAADAMSIAPAVW